MSIGGFVFGEFTLDPRDRRLSRGSEPVELNARYLDALTLLVGEQGRLVTKDRFLEEVWRGVPVTDEALTQCIRTLRRVLGDDAARPRFIETVPKHGYRFIALIEDPERDAPLVPIADPRNQWRDFLLLAGAGTVGGGMAGLVGGLLYGFGASAQPLQPGVGAVSVLLVVVCLTIGVALLGAAGVALGIAAAEITGERTKPWSVAGGAAGGLVVGAVVRLIGLDAFNLLFGQAPGQITGAGEGALLGAAVGLGWWLASRSSRRLARATSMAALAGCAAGVLIGLLGGRLMAGSLVELAQRFPGSRLRLDSIGSLFGEDGLGPIARIVTGGIEGALFAGCVVGAMLIARRQLDSSVLSSGRNR
jgi:DNA-binding winged helix-turn-helix (wHTH) protein